MLSTQSPPDEQLHTPLGQLVQASIDLEKSLKHHERLPTPDPSTFSSEFIATLFASLRKQWKQSSASTLVPPSTPSPVPALTEVNSKLPPSYPPSRSTVQRKTPVPNQALQTMTNLTPQRISVLNSIIPPEVHRSFLSAFPDDPQKVNQCQEGYLALTQMGYNPEQTINALKYFDGSVSLAQQALAKAR